MKILYTLLVAALACIAVYGQRITAPDALLNKMVGQWVLKGTLAGKETVHDVQAQRVLNGQYLQFTEVSQEKDSAGRPRYSAVVYMCWQQPKKEYFCLWLDNTSNEGITNQIVATAKQNGDTIALLFNFSEKTKFHTTFVYNQNADTWQWLMDDDENGILQPFARVMLVRK